MIIQHNMQAANANRMLGSVVTSQSKSTEKLSSGYRINRAADDAAGLSISEKMRAQIRGLNQGSTNAQDGISLAQTAEGALNETHAILQRMRQLAVQGANGTETSVDRAAINTEMDQLVAEIDRISTDTEFNTMKLLDGSFDKKLHVGANKDQTISISIGDMSATGLSVNSLGLDADDQDTYNTAIETINSAIESVSTERGNIGAIQNRLEHTIANVDTAAENLQAAESRIRDVDMAEEMVTYSKNSIIQQAAQSMLAQANQSNQGVLSLLQ
ncbi:MAG: flagellin [Lachnospiraceae bacterium]|nr:flagellin [Lachnospiraceae bacterium]